MQDYQREKLTSLIPELMRDKIYTPMKARELANFMNVPKTERAAFQELLDSLVAEGRIGVSVHGKYGQRESFLHRGVFHAHPRGFGFVTEEGRDRDIFIPAGQTASAMDGDTVRFLILREERSGGSAEGQVTAVLQHAVTELVGIYRKSRSAGYVVPDNQKLSREVFIPQGQDLHAVSGHKVVVRITKYADPQHRPEGRITEILGHVSDPGVDILSVIRAFGLPEVFSKDLMQAAAVPEKVTEEQLLSRSAHDFRELMTVSIDGEDAKDLDDAISLELDEASGNYRLYVHIADVSEYVREHSLLDQEALNRGTSVYLADRVVPMLPRALSNGICSLNEGEDRLTLSCIMDISPDGALLSHELCESVIRSDKRMSYHAVHALLSGTEPENGESLSDYLPYRALLQRMHALSLLLRKRRRERGGIDFDFPESRLLLDDRGKVLSIRSEERTEANQLIEDFMLAANEAVAGNYFWQDLPFLYRVHERPEADKLQQLSMLLSSFGCFLRFRNAEDIRPKEFQRLLEKVKGSAEEAVISTSLLRSMKQARYSTECSGHFGLAAEYYTHFTSPIRRYPDLQIHRIIKEQLRGKLSVKRIGHYRELLPAVADRCSSLERRAVEAERETEKLKKCDYMRQHLGEEFQGIISGVTSYGLYVLLENTVEGMVSVRSMEDDYYIFREERYELRGERTGKLFRLGDSVRIEVMNVDRLMRTIDFRLLPGNIEGDAPHSPAPQH